MSTKRVSRAVAQSESARVVAAERERIDRIDDRILALLNQRARAAQRIGKQKARDAGRPGGANGLWVPSREKKILDRLRAHNRGPLSDDIVRTIFREIISGSRALEARLTIAYLGPEGTFTHAAARQQFGAGVDLVPSDSIAQVFADVENGRAEFGVVPVENSTEGAVTSTLDLLIASPLQIAAEILLDVRQCLLGTAKNIADVRRVLSHPQGIAQCRRWLTSHLPGVAIEEVASTARAAALARESPKTAAIASELAGERYGLRVLAAGIQDESANVTRFLVLGAADARAAAGDDKTSVVCTVKDEPGILAKLLQPLAKRGVSLSKIESRPLRGRPWEYVFFLDLQGHRSDPRLERALADMTPLTTRMRILGSYPSGR